jgi:GDP/UDP-N,N'-diacetylbacillosamine 2-epimerase (hydrolysing)
MKKKILIFSGSRADYGLLKPVVIKLKKRFKTLVCCGPQHFSSKFNYTFKEIEKDRVKINSKIKIDISKTNISEIIQIISKSLIKINSELDRLKPDLVLVLGDRYEVFSMVICAYLKNIKLAHIHGGEVSEGSFDEGLRHSITKMSNLHFVSHFKHKKNVLQLGEHPNTIHNVGALGAENVENISKILKRKKNNADNYILVTFHSETKNLVKNLATLKNIFKLIKLNKDFKFYFTNSNSDTDGIKINKLINNFCKVNRERVFNLKSLGHKNYLEKMYNAKMIIGNSSSAIIEGSSFKIPSLNIGTRQKGRLVSNNIVNSSHNFTSMQQSFKKALKIKKNKIKKIFYKKGTANIICNQIEKYLKKKIYPNKKFYEI